MAPVSRRAVLSAALGAVICRAAASLASSTEPILRNPGTLIADLRVTWPDREAQPLWPVVAETLSSQLHSILRDEARQARLATLVLRRPLVLEEAPYDHSALYVRMRMDLKAVSDAKRTIGTVGIWLERLGFETVQFARPATTFMASNDELLTRSADAVREQLATFVGVLAATEV
jgi:hypothetical protein